MSPEGVLVEVGFGIRMLLHLGFCININQFESPKATINTTSNLNLFLCKRM